MIQLTFYKGVPFSTENKDVLFVSESERQLFLQSYEINAVPIQIDKFAVNGTDDNSIIDVTLEQEPFDTNYLKVVQELDTLSERTIYYFVNSVQTVAPNTFRLNLTVDIWNTYFLKTNATSTNYEIPLMKNALCIAGHGFENGGEAEEIAKIGKSIEPFTFSSFSATNKFYILLHATTNVTRISETTFITENTYSISNAQECVSQINTVSQFAIGSETYNMNKLNCYIVPAELLPNFSGGAYSGNERATIAGYQFLVSNYFSIFPVSSNNTVKKTTSVTITPEKAKRTTFGTFSSQIELPYNSKSYNITIETVVSNDLSICIIGNNQTISITNDFEYSIQYDEYNQYMSIHKSSLEMKNIGRLINAGLASFGALKNIGGSINALTNISMDYFGQQAQLADLSETPFQTIKETGSVLNIFLYMGLGTFVWTPANYDDIIAYDEYFGYKFDGFYDTLSIVALAETDRFRFLQCSEINIIGKFTMGVKNALESLFKRGLRIWYHKEHYLDSQAQQINEKQGE